MKKLLYLAIVLCTCLVSCSKEDSYSRLIIGVWDVVGQEYKGEVKRYTDEEYKEKKASGTISQFIFTKEGIVKMRNPRVISEDTNTMDEIEYSYSFISTSAGPKLEMSGEVYTIYSLTSKELVFGIETYKFICQKD